MKIPDHLIKPYPIAKRFTDTHRCSRCWGRLIVVNPGSRARPDLRHVWCGDCKEETPGFVTYEWIESKKTEQRFEENEVLRNYPELAESLGRPRKPKRSEEEIKRDLGY